MCGLWKKCSNTAAWYSQTLPTFPQGLLLPRVSTCLGKAGQTQTLQVSNEQKAIYQAAGNCRNTSLPEDDGKTEHLHCCPAPSSSPVPGRPQLTSSGLLSTWPSGPVIPISNIRVCSYSKKRTENSFEISSTEAWKNYTGILIWRKVSKGTKRIRRVCWIHLLMLHLEL